MEIQFTHHRIHQLRLQLNSLSIFTVVPTVKTDFRTFSLSPKETLCPQLLFSVPSQLYITIAF